jgi:hypothetical protein
MAWLNQPLLCKRCGATFQVKHKSHKVARSSGGFSRSGTLLGAACLGVATLAAVVSWPFFGELWAKSGDNPTAAAKPVAQPSKKITETAKPQADQPAPQTKPAPKKAPAKKAVDPLTKPERLLDPPALARFIDRAIQNQLDQENIVASPAADDAEFLRRACLDIAGIIPPAEKVAAFLDSKDVNKRAKLIDELLANPRYGQHLAEIWVSMLLPRNSDNRRLQSEPLHRWLAESFNSNKPWSKLASELITATGTQDEKPAVTFFMANPTPDKVTDTVTRLFLGVQLQCAQCHNHPFTSWKQDEYWAMAAFFSKVRMNGRVKGAAKKGVSLMVSEAGQGKALKRPISAKNVPPKFLQGDRPTLDAGSPYRPALAQWMTAPKNPFFARAMVNRTWAHFFGRGFVNPVDDMHDQNSVSHPLLLEALAEQFAGHEFNLKDLIRAVCNSQAYQRTSKPLGGNEADESLFSHMAVKVMSPEQLYDSLNQVVGSASEAAPARGKKPAPANKKRGVGGPRQAFVAFFLTDDGADPTEYQAGIPQALRLMNSPQFRSSADLLNKILAQRDRTDQQVIEQLYLATVSRRPTAPESQKLTAYVRQQEGGPRKAFGDILWALLNSSEFALNH